MSHVQPQPRCPKGKLARQICVTQKCEASPFMCLTCCKSECELSHRYCKTMQWKSALDMLSNYRKSIPAYFVCFMERVQKIYTNIREKVNREMRLFRQYIETQLLSEEYMKLMYFLNVEQYDKITSRSLSTIFATMTAKPLQAKFSQADKFTVNEMRVMDRSIDGLLRQVENFYRDKFTLLKKQIKGRQQKLSNNQFERSQSSSKLSQTNSQSPEKLSPNRKMSQSTLIQKSKDQFIDNKLALSQMLDRPKSRVKGDLDYPKAIPSLILTTATVLNHLIGRKVKEYKLVYRASENKFEIEEFYKKMAHNYYSRKQTPFTLILLKTQYGKVLGGATKLKWTREHLPPNQEDEEGYMLAKGGSENHKEDVRGGTFMFSADMNERYELMHPQNAIYCGRYNIGFGRKDLRIVNHADKHSKSYVGFPDSFKHENYLAIKKSSLVLTGSKESAYFKIGEWEAFEIVFK